MVAGNSRQIFAEKRVRGKILGTNELDGWVHMVSHEIYLQLSRIAGGDVKKIELALYESVYRKGKGKVEMLLGSWGYVPSVPIFPQYFPENYIARLFI
jgi:hypothetical protein